MNIKKKLISLKESIFEVKDSIINTLKSAANGIKSATDFIWSGVKSIADISTKVLKSAISGITSSVSWISSKALGFLGINSKETPSSDDTTSSQQSVLENINGKVESITYNTDVFLDQLVISNRNLDELVQTTNKIYDILLATDKDHLKELEIDAEQKLIDENRHLELIEALKTASNGNDNKSDDQNKSGFLSSLFEKFAPALTGISSGIAGLVAFFTGGKFLNGLKGLLPNAGGAARGLGAKALGKGLGVGGGVIFGSVAIDQINDNMQKRIADEKLGLSDILTGINASTAAGASFGSVVGGVPGALIGGGLGLGAGVIGTAVTSLMPSQSEAESSRRENWSKQQKLTNVKRLEESGILNQKGFLRKSTIDTSRLNELSISDLESVLEIMSHDLSEKDIKKINETLIQKREALRERQEKYKSERKGETNSKQQLTIDQLIEQKNATISALTAAGADATVITKTEQQFDQLIEQKKKTTANFNDNNNDDALEKPSPDSAVEIKPETPGLNTAPSEQSTIIEKLIEQKNATISALTAAGADATVITKTEQQFNQLIEQKKNSKESESSGSSIPTVQVKGTDVFSQLTAGNADSPGILLLRHAADKTSNDIKNQQRFAQEIGMAVSDNSVHSSSSTVHSPTTVINMSNTAPLWRTVRDSIAMNA